jgi:predicted alpha/beta hydrolase family esterase
MHALIVHGWMEYPDFAWIPWLQTQLKNRGYTTEALLLPNPDFPDRETWVRIVRNAIKDPDTVLICHSLGCPTALLALQEYEGDPLKQVILVAGFARPFLLALQPWFAGVKFDFEAIKAKAEKWIIFHSEKDLIVPYAEGAWLASQLNEPLITLQKGHLIQEEGITEFPELLEHLEP